MTKTARLAFAAFPFLLALACTDPSKVPAEAALQAAESAVATLGEVAAKYVPDQTQALQQSLADAKALLAKKDYKGALAAASAIPAKAKEVLAAANAKKDELVKSWGELSGSLPQLLTALKSRLDILSQAKKLPQGMDKGTLEQAKQGLAAVETGFGAAQEQAKSGDLSAAIAKGTELKAKGMEIMKSIGMM